MKRYGIIASGYANISQSPAQGTNGGTNVVGDNIRIFDTIEPGNTIGVDWNDAAPHSQIKVPAGAYIVNVKNPAGAGVGAHRTGIYFYTLGGVLIKTNWGANATAPGVGQNLAETETYINSAVPFYIVDHHNMAAQVLNTGLGVPNNQAGVNEHYAEIAITKIGEGGSVIPAIPAGSIILSQLNSTLQDTFGSNANGYWEKNAQTGRIRQYGITSVNVPPGGSLDITFPIPFPNLLIYANLVGTVYNGVGEANNVIPIRTLTGMRLSSGNSIPQLFFWEAVGI